MKKTLILVLMLAFASPIFAGTPEWTLKVGSTVITPKWMKQSASGTLIVGTEKGLVGIDPTAQKTIWEKAFITGFSENQCINIPGSPYLLIQYDATGSLSAISSSMSRIIIIDAGTGNEVFNSKEDKIRVDNFYSLPKIGCLLMETTKDKVAALTLIDYNTGETRWSTPMGEGKSRAGAMFGALAGVVKSSLRIKNKYPKVDAENNILMINGKRMMRLDAKSGAILWDKEFDKNIGNIMENADQKIIYFGQAGKSKLWAISLVDGKEMLDKPLSLDGEFNNLVPYSKDEVLVMHSNGFNILNVNSYTFKWKKDAKCGQTDDIRMLTNGFVAATIKEKEAVLTYVDMEGKKQWDETVKGALITYDVTPKGIYYLTEDRCNILTTDKGKDVWKKDIKIKGIPRYYFDKANNRVVMYAKESLYSFNMGEGEYKVLLDNIAFTDYVDKDEDKKFGINGFTIDFNDHNDVIEIENVNNKYLVRSNQNFWLVDMDGNVAYKKYFPAPGLSKGIRTAGQILSGLAATAGYGVAASGATKAVFSGNDSQINAGSNMMEGSQEMVKLLKRAAATSTTKDNIYVLAKFDDGNKGLICMNKATGNETQRIAFADNTPIYTVDDIQGKLYLLTGTTLSAYNLEVKN